MSKQPTPIADSLDAAGYAAAAVAQLRGQVEFWKVEASAWREAFEQQRGGNAFDDQQKELAAARAERIAGTVGCTSTKTSITRNPKNLTCA